MLRIPLLAALALMLVIPSASVATPPATERHVFVIVLENENFNDTFGPNPGSPYLAHDLVQAGVFLPNYYGVGHASLDNYIAMASGQTPNPTTMGDCPFYTDFHGVGGAGAGCVYPASTPQIGDQLAAAGLTWRAYAQSMAASPGVAPTACRHQPLNSQDTWQGEGTPDEYATRHVPAVYFHSVIDDQASCDAHVVDLARLQGDLQSASATPNYVFITPDVCADGHDATCKDASRPGGYAGIEQFLREWVPRIQASPAYAQGGVIQIIFDEAGASDAGACCNEPFPVGGGRTGAVMLSACVTPGTVDETPYNHYSLLRGQEDAFGVAHLGNAAQAGLAPLRVPC